MNRNTRWAYVLWWVCFANAWWCSLGAYFVSKMFVVPALTSLLTCWALNEWMRVSQQQTRVRSRS